MFKLNKFILSFSIFLLLNCGPYNYNRKISFRDKINQVELSDLVNSKIKEFVTLPFLVQDSKLIFLI
jgi:hypothetical protein